MNKREMFKVARGFYPENKPSRASGFILTNNGKDVIIAGFDEQVSLVLYNETDLYRLFGLVKAAIQTREEEKKK